MFYDKDSGQRVPVKVWTDVIEDGALVQAMNLARLPFAVPHVALMPDVHQGYGMPIGGVLAARDYIVPNAIGVDIGCGVQARRTNVPAAATRAAIAQILSHAGRSIRVGIGTRGEWQEPQPDVPHIADDLAAMQKNPVLEAAWAKARCQLGSLGSGNHFVEYQQDDDGQTWVMVHSGSRSLGKRICDHFDAIATTLNERYHSVVPTAWELPYLHVQSSEGKAYLAWMTLALRWAEENRLRMLDAALAALWAEVGAGYEVVESIDTHHNYAAIENHFGLNLWVHRKGAVRARLGEMVLIPGSMETASYVARGLGCAEAFCTSPHGAGRQLSRAAAKRARTAEDVYATMDRAGIHLEKTLRADAAEEGAHAYKDVDAVIEDARDLVEPVYRLRPLGVLKG